MVPRRGINDEGRGKKHALHRLISAATTDYVWLQDDDVCWDDLELGIKNFEGILDNTPSASQSDLYILPLRMVSERAHPSLLERLQIAEYAAIQQLTVLSAQRGWAVMCSGANMIARRDRWLESFPDLHPEIPSGDDMFLLESFKRRGLQITVIDQPLFEAIVRPHTSWRLFFYQRMRWAGKAPKYTDRDILCCGAIVVIINLLQLVFPLLILFKFPFEYRLIKKRDTSVTFSTALLLELLYPFYLLIALIGGFFRRSW